MRPRTRNDRLTSRGRESAAAGGTWSRLDVVHIGYPKTGSTWLQTRVFPHAIDHTAIRRDPEVHQLFADLKSKEDFSPGPLVEVLSVRRQMSGHPLVLSDESLSGALWAGGTNAMRTAERLRSVLPSATILIFVREQADMLRSIYAQYVQEGGYGSFRRLLQGRLPGCGFDARHLDYHPLVMHYVQLFGRERVLLMPYEAISGSANAFIDHLAQFVPLRADEIDFSRANPSIGDVSQAIMRGWNAAFRRSKFNPSPLVPLPGGRSVRRVMQHRVDPRVKRLWDRPKKVMLPEGLSRLYAEGNAKLNALTSYDLARLGYGIP